MSEKANFDDETLESMMTDYRNGMSFLDLSMKYGSTHTTIRKYLRLHGCEGRRREYQRRKSAVLRGEPELFGIPIEYIQDNDFGLKVGDTVIVKKTALDNKCTAKTGGSRREFSEAKCFDRRRVISNKRAVVAGITKYDIIVQYFLRNGKLGYREAIGKTRLYSFSDNDSEILEVTKVEG